jgi:Family of unknown function (DUF6212)
VISVGAATSLFPALYDGLPKAVFIGSSAVRAVEPTVSMPVRILCASWSEGGNLIQLADPGAPSCPGPSHALSVPPANVWCVCTGGDDTALELARQLLGWWGESAGTDYVPALWSDPPAVIGRRLLDRALTEVAGLQKRNEALQRSLSALREEWASTARIPPELVELLENLRVSTPRLIFGRTHFAGDVAVPRGPEFLVQPLPAWSRGLAGIDLHIARGSLGSGTFFAALYAVDADRGLADWQIPFSDLRRGWLPLRVPEALDRSCRVLELRLWSIGDDAESPLYLSLTPAGLLDEFAARSEPRGNIDMATASMTAIRLWGGLPGMPWEPSGDAAPHPLGGELILPILEHAVAQVRATRKFEAPFRWFGCLPGGRVLLHPLQDRGAAAMIPLPPVSALRAVTCEVVIEDPRRRTPIACKVVVADPGATVDQAESEDGVLASSGWVTLAQPEHLYSVTAAVTQPHFGPVNVHLFTRVADDGPDFYGRTVFGRFELRIDSQTAWEMPPVPVSTGKERT